MWVVFAACLNNALERDLYNLRQEKFVKSVYGHIFFQYPYKNTTVMVLHGNIMILWYHGTEWLP